MESLYIIYITDSSFILLSIIVDCFYEEYKVFACMFVGVL